jgi:hypothetical protein
MNAYIVVEGPTDEVILRALLPDEVLDSLVIVPVGSRSSPVSIARTLLVTKHKPVVLLTDSDTRNETRLQEQRQTTEELLKAVSGKIPVKVILCVPEIETVFFHAPQVIERVFGGGMPKELFLLARDRPKEILSELFAREAPGPRDLRSLLDVLDHEDIEALRSAPPIRELIKFLTETATRPPQTTPR